MTLLERMALIIRILEAAPLTYGNEYDLQDGLHHALEWDFVSRREYQLSDKRSRIDLFIPTNPLVPPLGLITEGIGIEVKIDGSAADVMRQLTRYALCPEIHGLILVTTRSKHHHVPLELNGKPVRLLSLVGAGL